MVGGSLKRLEDSKLPVARSQAHLLFSSGPGWCEFEGDSRGGREGCQGEVRSRASLSSCKASSGTSADRPHPSRSHSGGRTQASTVRASVVVVGNRHCQQDGLRVLSFDDSSVEHFGGTGAGALRGSQRSLAGRPGTQFRLAGQRSSRSCLHGQCCLPKKELRGSGASYGSSTPEACAPQSGFPICSLILPGTGCPACFFMERPPWGRHAY